MTTWTGIYTNGIRSAITDGTEVIPEPTLTVETQVVVPIVSLPDGMSENGWELTSYPHPQALAQRTIESKDPRWDTLSQGIPINEPAPWVKATAVEAAKAVLWQWWHGKTGSGIPVTLLGATHHLPADDGRVKGYEITAGLLQNGILTETSILTMSGRTLSVTPQQFAAAATEFKAIYLPLLSEWNASLIALDAVDSQAEIDLILGGLS